MSNFVANQILTHQALNDAFAAKLDVDGSGGINVTGNASIGGALTLSGNPTTALQAATKGYADLMLPLVGGTMTGSITLATTNQNFGQNGAVIHRLSDRIFLGGAVANDGLFPNVAKDWLTTYQNSLTFVSGGSISGSGINAALFSINNNSAASASGACFGSQSLHFGSAGTSCIGLTSIVVNNNTTFATNAWGAYIEAHRLSGTVGGTSCIELDIRSLAASEIKPNPWQQTVTRCLQLGAGAGVNATGQTNAGAAIQIVPNPMAFRVGINFMHDAIEGTDGTSGGATALSLGSYQFAEWFNSNGDLIGRIGATTAASTSKTEIRFVSTGLQFLGNSGQSLGYFFNVASAVNYFTMSPSVTGSPVLLSAQGSDTNVGLKISGQGTSGVLLGAYSSSSAPTATNIPASFCAVWKNTSDASVKLYYNDAGTLKSVALT